MARPRPSTYSASIYDPRAERPFASGPIVRRSGESLFSLAQEVALDGDAVSRGDFIEITNETTGASTWFRVTGHGRVTLVPRGRTRESDDPGRDLHLGGIPNSGRRRRNRR